VPTQVTYLLGGSAPWLTVDAEPGAFAALVESALAAHKLIRLVDIKTGTSPLHINPNAVVLLRPTETKAQWQLGEDA
jgi:hypothetical protein